VVCDGPPGASLIRRLLGIPDEGEMRDLLLIIPTTRMLCYQSTFASTIRSVLAVGEAFYALLSMPPARELPPTQVSIFDILAGKSKAIHFLFVILTTHMLSNRPVGARVGRGQFWISKTLSP
jgi:hypothetical protein